MASLKATNLLGAKGRLLIAAELRLEIIHMPNFLSAASIRSLRCSCTLSSFLWLARRSLPFLHITESCTRTRIVLKHDAVLYA